MMMQIVFVFYFSSTGFYSNNINITPSLLFHRKFALRRSSENHQDQDIIRIRTVVSSSSQDEQGRR